MIFHFLSTTSNISGGRKNIIFTAYILSGSEGGEAHLILINTEKNKETLPKFTFPARIVSATRTEISCKLMRKLVSLSVSTQKRRVPKLDCKKKKMFALSANTCVCLSCASFSAQVIRNRILMISSGRTAISCELKRISQHDSHFQHKWTELVHAPQGRRTCWKLIFSRRTDISCGRSGEQAELIRMLTTNKHQKSPHYMIFIYSSVRTEISCRPKDKACIGLIFTQYHVFWIITGNCSYPMYLSHLTWSVFRFFVTTTTKKFRMIPDMRKITASELLPARGANTRVCCSSGS